MKALSKVHGMSEMAREFGSNPTAVHLEAQKQKLPVGKVGTTLYVSESGYRILKAHFAGKVKPSRSA